MSYNCVSGYYHVFLPVGNVQYRPTVFTRASTPSRWYSYGSVSVSLSVSVSVCLSVTRRSSIETAEGIELAFGIEASFDLSYTAF